MSTNQEKNQLPFRLRSQFLSYTELALLSALLEMTSGRYVICPKVALNDIFFIQRPNENVHFYSKIFRKHVDFLLCEPKTMKPAFAVEVIKPVAKDEARSADQFMQGLFLDAGLPLIQVRSSEKYDLGELVRLFKQAMNITIASGLSEDKSPDTSPFCPRCGLVMVLRIHRSGPDKGKRYYGCMNAPSCRGIVPID